MSGSKTAKTLKGSVKRLFMARTVEKLGPGGQRLAQRQLGWNRETIRKGTQELRSGFTCAGAFRLRGRKSIRRQPDEPPHAWRTECGRPAHV